MSRKWLSRDLRAGEPGLRGDIKGGPGAKSYKKFVHYLYVLTMNTLSLYRVRSLGINSFFGEVMFFRVYTSNAPFAEPPKWRGAKVLKGTTTMDLEE